MSEPLAVQQTGDSAVPEQPGVGRRRARGQDVRIRLVAHLSDLVKDRGHVVTTTKALADSLDLSTATVAYAVRKLVADGMLSTKSLGPRGQRFVVERKAARLTAAPGGRPRARSQRLGQFCPWCGRSVQPAWRYCVHCGKGLPRTRRG